MSDLFAGRILIVDDEPVNVRLLERLLQSAGYREIATTTDPRRVLEIYRDFKPDLVLLDLMMPHLDGVAVLGQLKAEIPAEAYLPVIVLTADATAEAKRRALSAGARDFLTKPFEQFEMLLRIGNLLETRRLHVALAEHNRSLEETVRQRTEQLLQSEKVATMGALLAGVAHELNNPLAVVSGQAQLLHRPNQDPSVQHRAKRISDAADRCVRIVRNFLALARQRPPERSRTMLKEVLDGAVELLGYELRTDSVEVVVDVPEGLPVLWADPHQLHQVLVNLITNAHHAMRRQERPRRLSLTVRHDAVAGRVCLAIADSGAGIILVVDDEASIAEVLADSFERDGHSVAVAGNGAVALELLERESFDLVVSDTKMPVLDGERFYGEVARRFPALRRRVIFVTGDALSREKRQFLESTGAPFLNKPFDLEELRRLVQSVLAGERPSA